MSAPPASSPEHHAALGSLRPGWTLREQQAACSHQWQFAGAGAPHVDGCDQTQRMACSWCQAWFDRACGSARPRRCAYCAEVKRGDVAAVGRSGWVDSPDGRGVWLTLTAPGQDVLPFDSCKCNHSEVVPCSGSIGCVVESDAMAIWHADMPARWTHFVTELRRSLNPGLTGPPSSWPVQVEFFKTYELQRRGALHVHAMVRVSGACTHRRFVAMCSKARRLNGFGPQMKAEAIDLTDDRNAAVKAGYCSKYAAKNADVLRAVDRLDVRTGEVTQGGLRSWSASRRWGETMKSVQARRCRWWVAQATPAQLTAPHARPPALGPLDLYCPIYASGQSEPP